MSWVDGVEWRESGIDVLGASCFATGIGWAHDGNVLFLMLLNIALGLGVD